MAGLQKLEHFVKQTALRHIGQQGRRSLQRFGGARLQGKAQVVQLGSETHGADDAHWVFAVTGGRVANHAQDTLFGVFQAMVVIDDVARQGVVVHGIDGEVTPRRIFFLRAPDVVAQHTATGVHRMGHIGEGFFAGALIATDLLGVVAVKVSTEGGDFNHFVFTATAINHMDDAKASPNDESTAKTGFHLFGRGVGGHIKVFGLQAHQQIAHRTAHDIGLKATLLQGTHHVHGTLVHQGVVNAVILFVDDAALAKFRCRLGATAAHQTVNDFADHEVSKRSRIRHPRSWAICLRAGPPLVTTGTSTFSSKGKSFIESL